MWSANHTSLSCEWERVKSLWYRGEIVIYWVTIIRRQELIYLLDSKAMKPKGNVIIAPNVLFQKYLIDKGL